MKKVIVGIILFVLILLCFSVNSFATEDTILQEDTTNNIIQVKEKVNSKIDEYTEKYGSETYGFTAYILNLVRWYSIPVCFMGIIVGALNQYVLGTRRLDRKHKGYGMIMTFVTLLVICQVLPLVFTLVVIGWRG